MMITDRTTLPPLSAAAWSLCYGAFGLWWAAGGAGFPYGPSDRAARMGAVLVGVPARFTGVVVAFLGLTGALVGFALAARYRHTGHGGTALRALAACLGGVLLLVVPDGRLLLALGELMVLHPERVEAAAAHQAFCAAGGALLLWAARPSGGRRHRVLGPVSARRERRFCYLAAALPLLYAGPRLLWALGWTVGLDAATTEMVTSPTGRTRELVFAGAAAAGGLLTLGLTQRWGTRIPGAVPWLGGRRVPIPLATVPAGVVALALIGAGATMWRALAGALLGSSPSEDALSAANWGAWLGNLAWLPWGIALAVAVRHYRRRRITDRREGGSGQPVSTPEVSTAVLASSFNASSDRTSRGV
ncbi:hypothetical protein [Cryptosporangium minutisporangium]|uniref:DUF3995 domain-containing protein n=1 Tax=Cryptosporangium minutisporangium TaxID=113569 RepID=A0ABP6SSF8_9ACTN